MSLLLGAVGTLATIGGVLLAGWQVRLQRRTAPGGRVIQPGRVPRQLPATPAHFTGRASNLVELAASTRGRRGSAQIAVICGPPGIGKTTLALHWAHRVRRRFPDGDLYVNLRGYDAAVRLEPGQVIEDFLHSLHVPSERIPIGLAAKSALYRTELQGRRMLIMLDNAATAEQVRPLLPGTSGCTVVVTSRSRLSGLAARDGVRVVVLAPLSNGEAVGLLRQVVGEARVSAEPAAASELARLCGHLPLALRIAADRVTAHPAMLLAELVRALARQEGRLDELATVDDETTTVRIVFSWSYHALPVSSARLFRLLGLHAGPDISEPAAAALAGCTADQVRGPLEALTGAHLLQSAGSGRYRFHDLLRLYAGECAVAEETAAERDAAVRRILSWYLLTAVAAGRAIDPARPSWVHIGAAENDPPPLTFASRELAIRWCEEERANLVAAVRQAFDAGLYETAWKLPYALWDFYILRKPWTDWVTTHRIALEAAVTANDRHGEAHILNYLGGAYRELGQFDEGLDCRHRSLALFREAGYRTGEAMVLANLGHAHLELKRYDEALACTQQGLSLWREVGDRWGEGWTLNNIGMILTEMQRYPEAIEEFRQALIINQEIGNRWAEGVNTQDLAIVLHRTGQHAEANDRFHEALAIHRDVGSRWSEASTQQAFGDLLHDLGQHDAARERWREALGILQTMNQPHPKAESPTTAELRLRLGMRATAANPDRTTRIRLMLARFKKPGSGARDKKDFT